MPCDHRASRGVQCQCLLVRTTDVTALLLCCVRVGAGSEDRSVTVSLSPITSWPPFPAGAITCHVAPVGVVGAEDACTRCVVRPVDSLVVQLIEKREQLKLLDERVEPMAWSPEVVVVGVFEVRS